MEVTTHVHVDPPRAGGTAAALTAAGATVALRVPDAMANTGFPARELAFDVPGGAAALTHGGALDAPKLAATATAIASSFCDRTNNVVFAFGTSATSKRAAIVDPQSGLAAAVLNKVLAAGAQGGPLVAVAFALSDGEGVKDLFNAANEEGRVTETVREGPRITDVTRKALATAADVTAFFAAVAANCAQKLAGDACAVTAPAAAAAAGPVAPGLLPFTHHAIVVSVLRYESADAAQLPGESEMNSLHFVVLPDAQRPALCGIDGPELKRFEFAQKCIAGAAGVIGAVLASRLRVPFGKSRLTGLFKRAYNGERGNKFNAGNKPTVTYCLALLSAGEEQAEESYHGLALLRKLYNPLGFTSSSLTLTRDMAAEKWRLEQDLVELRDELAIAKQVFAYKPCIVEQTKPVANIHEEEQRRVGEILKRREEARLKQQAELEQRAKAEAASLIAQEEAAAGATLRELEEQAARTRREYEAAEAEHARKRAEYERQADKIRKKRADEEELAEQLRQQVAQLEDEITSKDAELQRRRRQIEAANQNAANGRATAQRERDEVVAKRARLLQERRALRASWLEEIRATNERLLAQVTELERTRAKLSGNGGNGGAAADGASAAAAAAAGGGEHETEAGVREDIRSINEYLPRLIALEDAPADLEQSETIRQQLEEYFEQEKAAYATRLDAEKARLAALEKELLEYKGRAKEVQGSRRRELLAEAVKKEHHVQSIIDQVMQYLQNGVRLQKVSSNGQVRRRLFFISEDCKKIFACDLDASGAPINRRQPTMTIFVSDIQNVVLGVYTSSFVSFAGRANLKQQRDEAMRDSGSQQSAATQPITPINLGRYNYRAFALVLRIEKTVELVCDTDSDCEAWLVALKRLVSFKTPYERAVDQKCNRPCPPATADIKWGEPMDLHGRADFEKLYPEEIRFCAEHHVPPRLLVKTREDVRALAQQMIVTVYDIRKASSLDLVRSQALLDFFVDSSVIPRLY